jgi:hypothetical protein
MPELDTPSHMAQALIPTMVPGVENSVDNQTLRFMWVRVKS